MKPINARYSSDLPEMLQICWMKGIKKGKIIENRRKLIYNKNYVGLEGIQNEQKNLIWDGYRYLPL